MTDMTAAMIRYRMEQASITLQSARNLFNDGDLISAVNRIYYASFYAASAALLTKTISSSKHSGVISMFTREFVNQGLINKELGSFLNKLFLHRQEGDYQYFTVFDPIKVENWLRSADKFISDVRKLIESDQPTR